MRDLLIDAAERSGFNRLRLANRHIKVATTPFDPEVRMMATVHEDDGGYLYAVKGAPEAVLAHATMDDADRHAWLDENTKLAGQGLRVLARSRPKEGLLRDVARIALGALAPPADHDRVRPPAAG